MIFTKALYTFLAILLAFFQTSCKNRQSYHYATKDIDAFVLNPPVIKKIEGFKSENMLLKPFLPSNDDIQLAENMLNLCNFRNIRLKSVYADREKDLSYYGKQYLGIDESTKLLRLHLFADFSRPPGSRDGLKLMEKEYEAESPNGNCDSISAEISLTAKHCTLKCD